MRIAIDATPAAVQQGGVGRYARELLRALVGRLTDHQFILATAAPDDVARALLDSLPPGSWRELRRLPLAERWMTALWHRLRAPIPVERLIGPHDLFHGTDFVVPPGRASKVVTIHDLSFRLHPEFAEPSLARFLSAAVPRSIERADAIITVSASVAAELADLYPASRDKVVAIPNGVRLPSASTLPRGEADSPTILMVGTVEPRKNHLTALAAFDIVRQDLPDAHLTIIGRPGWRSEEIQRAIRDAQRQGGVCWIEAASDDELERAFAAAAVAISPSHYEGFGLPVLEAMARGAAVACSDRGAPAEVAGDAALAFDPESERAIADAILAVLRDPSLRERLAAAGPPRAASFTWERCAEETMDAYRRALR